MRRLGNTELVVSRLGLGLAAVGRPGYITLGRAHDLPALRTEAALYERTAALLDAAVTAGVRYVDVARSYGRAEAFLARWLDAHPAVAPPPTVGSKWGYRYTADWRVDAPLHEQKELSLARFREQLAQSRALLDDRLALYQIHSATADSGALEDQALLAALVEARRAGACRALGLTLSGSDARRALDRALAAAIDGERVFDVVQATYNVLERSLASDLAAAHAEGLGVIVKEAHANGRLTPGNRRPEDRRLRARLDELAHDATLPLDRLALAFVVAEPWVDVVLSGAATVVQLQSHAAALDATIAPAVRDALSELVESSDLYWRTRAALPWT
ncbi:aldo/keto reductase [Candidatus Binatia bacterium]|nr:aldo/keto reductase [Candidatus Binatia bacterium]